MSLDPINLPADQAATNAAAVAALEGSGIPVAAVSTAFPHGLAPLFTSARIGHKRARHASANSSGSPGMPLAVISANHQVEVVTRAREVGATFLQKPLTTKALEEFATDATNRLSKST